MTAAMKAIVQHAFGGPEVLKCEDIATPEPGPDDVLLRVHAVSVNRTLDLSVRAGTYVRKPKLPHILGVDPSGVIEAVGRNVATRKVGDRVFVNLFVPTTDPVAPLVREVGRVFLLGVDIWGGYAECVRVPACNTHLVPDGLSFHDATVIARHTPTALNLIENRGKVAAGEWVLVMGAAGGLGSAAVQIARLSGAKVIAAAGADGRVQAARDLGADYGINYRRQDLADEIARLTGGHGVDLVCENVGDPVLWRAAFEAMATGGRMVTAGAHAGDEVALSLRRLYLRRLQIIGDGSEAPGGIARAFELARDGKVVAKIDRVLPLREAAVAHELVAARDTLGKVLLDPTLA